MNSYHGTSNVIAVNLVKGNVDVSLGGGELGQGFYTGEHLYLAKAWAFHISGDKHKNVVQFSTLDSEIECLSMEILDHGSASLKRNELKKYKATRTYRFGVDLIWAPIVGKDKIVGDQYKWESDPAALLLNGVSCKRSII